MQTFYAVEIACQMNFKRFHAHFRSANTFQRAAISAPASLLQEMMSSH